MGKVPPIDYCDRCSYLIENNIGVWDVLRYADRDGSSDTDIQNAEPNDFDMFFKEVSAYKGYTFQWKRGRGTIQNFFPMIFRSIKHERVLSSSGALAKPFNVKLENWGNAINRMTK
jgi:hypoxanthine-DNA glycosylase